MKGGVKGLFGCDTCVHLCRCAHAWKSGCKRTMWWGGGGGGGRDCANRKSSPLVAISSTQPVMKGTTRVDLMNATRTDNHCH